jgi:hypothetical protein
MGNLAEQLYRAFCNAAGLVYGSDETPSFHNLPTEQREAWKAVEAKARAELAAKPVGPLHSAIVAAVGSDIAEQQRDRIEREYRELGAREPALFEACVRTGDAIKMRHGLSVEATADVEVALVRTIHEALTELGAW